MADAYHCAPMSTSSLPNKVDAHRWADRGMQLEQDVPLAGFARLSALLGEKTGVLSLKANFSRDPRRHPWLQLTLKASPVLICQRCLGPMAWEIDEVLSLHLLADESEVERLLDSDDYVFLDEEGQLDLTQVVEDELLLCLPMVGRHDRCVDMLEFEEKVAVDKPITPEGELGQETRKPFAALADLLAGKRD